VKHRIAFVLVALWLAGCKQGLGERCQVNADCSSNHCSMSDPQICVSNESNNMGDIDAMVLPPSDAAIPTDARTDAPTDAPADAPIDAPP
jgi:hypothetical protein